MSEFKPGMTKEKSLLNDEVHLGTINENDEAEASDDSFDQAASRA